MLYTSYHGRAICIGPSLWHIDEGLIPLAVEREKMSENMMCGRNIAHIYTWMKYVLILRNKLGVFLFVVRFRQPTQIIEGLFRNNRKTKNNLCYGTFTLY